MLWSGDWSCDNAIRSLLTPFSSQMVYTEVMVIYIEMLSGGSKPQMNKRQIKSMRKMTYGHNLKTDKSNA